MRLDATVEILRDANGAPLRMTRPLRRVERGETGKKLECWCGFVRLTRRKSSLGSDGMVQRPTATEDMGSPIKDAVETAVALVKGFSVTFKTMFEKTVTENYPAAPVNFQPRYRGIHVLHRDEGGLEKCVGCFLCAAACPANCIYIEAAENTEEKRISAGERYASVYNIDYSRCIFCGYCVEACPTDAITHGHGFELATYDINSLVYRKEQMLEDLKGEPPAGAKA